MTKTFIIIVVVALAVLLIPPAAHANSTLTANVAADPARIPNAPFTLVYGTKKFTASAAQVRTWYKTFSQDGRTYLQLRPGAIYDYLNTKVSPSVNDLGDSSRFVRIGGNLHLVGPGTKGKIVDGVKTSLSIRSALVGGKTSATVHMKEHRPSVFSAADFEKLSFPHLLAEGESNFAGSPANRIHNIHVATKRYDGLVLMPGEQFSFNQYLGSVDATNGYLPELVIKDNTTTPEYGGGICQVSTTAFRAAMEAGLKIDSRQSHSYPVAYYGTPGYDATIYNPNPDLKFTNDTGSPVYLRTQIAGTRLTFKVYGTSDGRQTTVNGPFVTNRYPDGSLTAAVAQIVKKNGKSIREQNFVSNYRPAEEFPEVRAANGG